MAGLYFHIPYCYRACTYCNFHFSTVFSTKEKVINSMIQELKYHAQKHQDSIQTIYFGGGTPSVLLPKEFNALMSAAHQHFNLTEIEEFTLECNPEDLNDEKLSIWKKQGVNRLSVGIQSFQDDLLKAINRQHSSKDAFDGINRARKHGFDNISMDLIMGLPQLSHEMLKEDIHHLLSLDPEHISAYQLSLEEKTKLAHQVKMGEVRLMNDEQMNEQFILMHDLLSDHSFIHYEVSNYAKEGHRAIHNSSYWKGEKYLGIGPGAHSFYGGQRRWNISNNNKYIEQIGKGGPWYESEKLNQKDQFNEMIMTSLRTIEGLDLNALKSNFPELYTKEIGLIIKDWERKKMAVINGEKIKLNPKGWLISDYLASDLFCI